MGFEHPSWTAGGWHDRGDAAPWVLDDDRVPAPPRLPRPVLVTAFGPFPGQASNPSELVVDELAGDEDVVGHVLDVSYRRAPDQLVELVRMVDPLAVVAFGVAAGATAVRLETSAHAVDRSDAPDVDGDVGGGRRIDTGPETIATRLDVGSLARSLTVAGIPVELSHDAGGFVCNHLFRRLVTHIDLLDRPVGFVHVPPTTTPGFDPARYGALGRIVVSAVIGGLVARSG